MPRRLTVIAGAGALAPLVVEAALRAGDAVQVLALTPQPELAGVEVAPASIADPQAVMLALRSFSTTHVVLAGGLALSDRRREELSEFLGGGGAAEGDGALSHLAHAIRNVAGAELIGAHDVATDLLADAGPIAGPRPDESLLESARLAFEAARHVGRLDLGQAAVVSGARVIAAEDIAGTDALLMRIAEYRRHGLIGDGTARLVLAKAAKPQQPAFVDLPAIGARTIANAAAAGIALIVVEAGRALLLERQAMLQAADEYRIGLFGMLP